MTSSKKFYEIQKAILKLDDEGDFSIERLKETLSPKPEHKIKQVSFLEFSQNLINDLIKVKRTGNALIYRTAVNRMLAFCNNPKITFQEINYSFLDAFRNKLMQDGVKKNTVGNYFRSIRAIYNKAIKAKVASRELYPFHEISIKTEKTAKRAISVDELARLYNYPKIANSQEWHAANYFFLSFTLRGMSFIDMAYLTTKNISKGYIIYKRRKTQKLYNIKLHPVAIRIIALYRRSQTGYLIPIFPFGTVEDGIQAKKISRQWIKQTNKYLKRIAVDCGIDSNITTYVSRHTWATTAKRLGYSNELIAEALGHEHGNKITNIYLDSFDQSLIDDANARIIQLLE